MRKIYIIGALACLVSACKPSVNITVPPTAGDANFSSYLAIGNSLTAGYADNSLYVTGQLNSYPRRLFEQFSLITDISRSPNGEFYQPLLATDLGYPTARKIIGLVGNCADSSTSVSAIDLPNWGVSSEDAKRYVSQGPNNQVNNIGVPGIRVADYTVNYYGASNPYAKRFYYDITGPSTPSDELQSRITNLHPTFFTMWLGSNDVLAFATGGGQGDGSGNATPGLFNYYPADCITPKTVFQTNYDEAVRIATSVGARGALINIPDITSIPFFTTIPSNGLYISRQSLADSLTRAYGNSTRFVFRLGYNQFIVRDHLGLLRQSVPGELILITTPKDSLTCAGWGSFKAIPQQYVITTEELQQIRSFTTEFNNIIANAARRNNLALIDMFSYMGTLQSGITFNGINYNAHYIAGGAFSLDAVHLTPRGYALVANKIIEGINTQYHATVPMIDVNKYHGILFP